MKFIIDQYMPNFLINQKVTAWRSWSVYAETEEDLQKHMNGKWWESSEYAEVSYDGVLESTILPMGTKDNNGNPVLEVAVLEKVNNIKV